MKPHLSHRLLTYTETKDGIELKFTNGSKATCDILVGADGINSVVRKVFLSKEKGIDPSSEEAAKVSQPVWSGTMVYRSLINSEVIRRVNPDHPALSTRVVVSKWSLNVLFDLREYLLFLVLWKKQSKQVLIRWGPCSPSCVAYRGVSDLARQTCQHCIFRHRSGERGHRFSGSTYARRNNGQYHISFRRLGRGRPFARHGTVSRFGVGY